jgi:hypothetical protein
MHRVSTGICGRYPRGKNKPRAAEAAERGQPCPRETPRPGEHANAQLKTWDILHKLRCCPLRTGKLAKAIHVLQLREA